ncbi:MAG: hypothetical protein K2H34_10075, partial [Lachnospiraceae bacterium]|nr:hypothetical protein [Lachnospiraceae bacterium]
MSEVIATLSPEKSLYHKLSDLQIVLHAFNEEMGDSYMVAEQLLSLLAETAGESKLLRKAHIYFDGFTGFTSVQYDVIEAMIKAGCTLYFSFTMDEELFGKNVYGEHELFASGRETVDRLCKLAEKHQVVVLPHVSMNKNYRLQQNPERLHLERQIFRFPVKEWRGEPSAVRLLAAKDVREEALFVAQTIKYYVMHKGYHYRDFAVVTGDIEQQSAIWQRCMEQMEVPYFLDYSEMLSHNPVVEIIAMVMELFRSDFSYAGVFAFLKTGFLEIPLERIYVLENYCLKYGVKGYSWWSKAFRGGVKGLHDINETREQFMSALEKMAPVFLKKKAPSKEYIMALYDFMSTNQMAERLMEKSIRLEEEGRLREAKAYGGVYEKWIAVLDKTMDILGEEVIERDTFMEVLMAGISDMRLGVIPSTINQVTIGDMERTRLHHVKVLFVAGANDGLLPKPVKDKGILADRDRRQLKEHSLSLAPDSREEMYLQQLYMYIQITQPDRELFISYRLTDDKGAELRPSYFIGRIKHIFPELKTEQAEKYMDSYLPAAQRELASRFAAWLVTDGTDDSSIYQILRNTDPQMTERILEGYYYHNQCELLDRAIVRKLYGEHMIHSVSRLETYAGCAYQFFLRYGLR